MNWFRVYKMPTGKPANAFAFDGNVQDKVMGVCVRGGGGGGEN